jgi:hypothetical protein
MPAVFGARTVALKDSMSPLEIRAIPEVTIEAQYVDSKGKATGGQDCVVVGRINEAPWIRTGAADRNGRIAVHVPRGLEEVRLDFITNEHGALRHRESKDAPLSNHWQIQLGTVGADVLGVEVFRYVAPIVLIDAIDEEGHRIKGFQARVAYPPGKSPYCEPGSNFIDEKGDVWLKKQQDERWRTCQLLPDEVVTVTVLADGYMQRSERLKLAEGAVRELQMVLQKSRANMQTSN